MIDPPNAMGQTRKEARKPNTHLVFGNREHDREEIKISNVSTGFRVPCKETIDRRGGWRGLK